MNEITLCQSEFPVVNLSSDELDRMNESPDFFHIVDNEHRCYFVNDSWCRLHNIKRGSLDGLPYSAIPHKAYDTCCDRFEEHDLQVFRSKKTVPSLEIHEYSKNEWLALLLIIAPVFEDNNISGLICSAKPLPVFLADKYHKIRSQISTSLVKTGFGMKLSNPEKLHDAEFDTAYLFLMGLQPKQIAAYRNVSENTVYATLTNIRIKCGLEKGKQIIDYGMENQWYDYIPNMFRRAETALRINNYRLV
ncbi:hypothetical protein NX722_09245 [Endozoicomonas gorgoniicola]|uniref:LuxR family transcriptional regulator n=1 Tax=Endozoicomonas gorgoniicola TaxID=1234144 RepID=A0ABT3MUR3_9GAMM|nr:hypothetical protein [Endozoicomonas gorgoniicola]MCW7552823.1 hypothetical protein [Endozoicomonas gorgoniicola]